MILFPFPRSGPRRGGGYEYDVPVRRPTQQLLNGNGHLRFILSHVYTIILSPEAVSTIVIIVTGSIVRVVRSNSSRYQLPSGIIAITIILLE